MALDERLAKRIRSSLGRRKVAEKKMFGRGAFLLNGKMCVGIHKSDLIARLAPAGRQVRGLAAGKVNSQRNPGQGVAAQGRGFAASPWVNHADRQACSVAGRGPRGSQ